MGVTVSATSQTDYTDMFLLFFFPKLSYITDATIPAIG